MADKKRMNAEDDKEFLEELQKTLPISDFDKIAMNHSARDSGAAETQKPDVIVILLDPEKDEMNGFQIYHCFGCCPNTKG